MGLSINRFRNSFGAIELVVRSSAEERHREFAPRIRALLLDLPRFVALKDAAAIRRDFKSDTF